MYKLIGNRCKARINKRERVKGFLLFKQFKCRVYVINEIKQ